MPGQNSNLTTVIIDTVRDIPRDEWDGLFGQELTEGYGYQKTLEESSLKEFSFGYLLLRRSQRTVALFPFFVMDFSIATLLPLALRKAITGFEKLFKRPLKTKMLFMGTPTAEEFYLGVADGENLDALLDEALKELRGFCRREKISMLVFNCLSEKNKPLAQCLKKRNFVELETLPTTSLEVKAESLEEYIQGLSRNTRKDLRKKLKRSSSLAQLRTETLQDITDIQDTVYKLYLNNFSDADVRFEVLTRDFFLNICRNMPEETRYFITYDADKIVAFNLCLVKGDNFIDKFIGFDYSVALKYHLYYTTFCHNIQWCIKNDLRYYHPGTTDYHPKMRLGAKLLPLYTYVKTANPLPNLLIKIFSRFIAPKNIDPVPEELK